MRITIRMHDDVSGLHEHALRRLQFALGRFGHVVKQVRLRVEDVNGPRSGIDQRCAVRITGPRLGTLFLEELDSDAMTAIDRLADRAGRAVSRALHRSDLGGSAPRGPGRTAA